MIVVARNFPNIAVLLPTFRQPEILILTLKDLEKQTYPHECWTLVIIDDGSCDSSTFTAISRFISNVDIIIEKRQVGGTYSHAKLFNELIRLAPSETDVFVHVEDVRLPYDYLFEHAKWHTKYTNALITGPMCEGDFKTFDVSHCNRWKLMKMSGVETDAYKCCFQSVFAKSMSYSRKLCERLIKTSIVPKHGPFDEQMCGWGYHETEFAFRAESIGALCVYDTKCAVYHPHHNDRDDRLFRNVDRSKMINHGTTINVDHLCQKHGLSMLPPWKVGIPLTAPLLKKIKTN
jgi:GT2 family glycosyltransferase